MTLTGQSCGRAQRLASATNWLIATQESTRPCSGRAARSPRVSAVPFTAPYWPGAQRRQAPSRGPEHGSWPWRRRVFRTQAKLWSCKVTTSRNRCRLAAARHE